MQIIAGVDEAGRGPLAGPVIAAAVILDSARPLYGLDGLNDSKKLSPRKREALYRQITEHCAAYAVGRAEVEEIDALNILQATMLAMRRAVLQLSIVPTHVLVDGNCLPDLPCSAEAIVRGDETEPAISAASIVAKVLRDREMAEWDQRYPEYGFAVHKGYPTRAHLAALQTHGVSVIHRRSFAPVKSLLLFT